MSTWLLSLESTRLQKIHDHYSPTQNYTQIELFTSLSLTLWYSFVYKVNSQCLLWHFQISLIWMSTHLHYNYLCVSWYWSLAIQQQWVFFRKFCRLLMWLSAGVLQKFACTLLAIILLIINLISSYSLDWISTGLRGILDWASTI